MYYGTVRPSARWEGVCAGPNARDHSSAACVYQMHIYMCMFHVRSLGHRTAAKDQKYSARRRLRSFAAATVVIVVVVVAFASNIYVRRRWPSKLVSNAPHVSRVYNPRACVHVCIGRYDIYFIKAMLHKQHTIYANQPIRAWYKKDTR